MRYFITSILLAFLFTGCDLLENDNDTDPGPDIAEGLKEALRVGTEVASGNLSATDGYFQDLAVKILLPDELEEKINAFKATEFDLVVETISGEDLYELGLEEFGIPSLQSLEDDLVLGLNRAAESAASEATPIFFDAITGLTIADANNILFGGIDTAATNYLRVNTFDALFNTYEPKMDNAVNAVKIGDTSVETLYNDFVGTYNDILNTDIEVLFVSIGTIAELGDLETINDVDLSSFATQKGLNGLFLKVSDEEAKIREDPLARVTEILQDVFGLLD